jgi:hypothetical protein
MNGPLSAPQMRWLSLINYQAQEAAEQSRRAAPLSTLAINGLQDAVEAMLSLIAEHNNIAVGKRPDFDKLFDEVAKQFPAVAHHRARLLALNAARVGFKHNGNEVSESTIERHRVNALNFLVEASTVGLGQDFEAISLRNLITAPEVRAFLESAESRWNAGDRHGGLADLRRAFDRLINTYEDSKMWHSTRSLFDTKPDSPSLNAARMREQAALGMFSSSRADYAEKWLAAIAGQVKLLAIGVDLRRYAYFNAHVPDVVYGWEDRDGHAASTADLPEPVRSTFDRCQRFVIDTALQLAAEDFTFNGSTIQEQQRKS